MVRNYYKEGDYEIDRLKLKLLQGKITWVQFVEEYEFWNKDYGYWAIYRRSIGVQEPTNENENPYRIEDTRT